MIHILMCSSPLDKRLPDDSYQAEYDALKSIGATVHLFDIYKLNSFRIAQGQGTRLLYHGWMMTPEHYQMFHDRCAELGYELVNSPEQYARCHHFKGWYSVLQDETPLSITVEIADVRSMMESVMQFMQYNNCGVIIKDQVKSIKHYWHEACYIPQGAHPVHVAKVIATFMQMKNDSGDLQGDLVVRKFVELKRIGSHNRSNMPLTKEFRSFVLDGKIIHTSKYWDQGQYDSEGPSEEYLQKIANKVFVGTKNNFFTFDVAQLTDESWTGIEVGDGQVSAVPEQEDRAEFFSKLLGK